MFKVETKEMGIAVLKEGVLSSAVHVKNNFTTPNGHLQDIVFQGDDLSSLHQEA